MTATDYVAILKAKQGELLAIQTAPSAQFVPLLEVIEPQRASSIGRAWPSTTDALWVQPINYTDAAASDWATAITTLFDELRTAGTLAVPVVTLDETPETYAAVRAIVAVDVRGLVLRLDCEDALEELPADLKVAIDTVLAECGASPDTCDLVLDSGLVSGGVAVQSNTATGALNALPYASDWRNIVAAFSGFPALVGDHVPVSSVGSIPRTDAAAFAHLITRWTVACLTYADYGVGVPTYSEVKWSPIPNIRYALPGEWKIHRAATKMNPSPQYIALASDVAAAGYFAGSAFSPGDAYIADVASGADGPGNAGSYLKAAMSRHFHVVLESLSTHGVP
ncbi:MAG: beta family protein [Rhodoglobus sp.]